MWKEFIRASGVSPGPPAFSNSMVQINLTSPMVLVLAWMAVLIGLSNSFPV